MNVCIFLSLFWRGRKFNIKVVREAGRERGWVGNFMVHSKIFHSNVQPDLQTLSHMAYVALRKAHPLTIIIILLNFGGIWQYYRMVKVKKLSVLLLIH